MRSAECIAMHGTDGWNYETVANNDDDDDTWVQVLTTIGKEGEKVLEQR